MWIILSHALGFAFLFIGAIFDLRTTEVPDWVSALGIGSGLLMHAIASLTSGNLEPLTWSLGVGLVFSIYGWGMYFLGMWGGADAFAMSVLGFAAPYSIQGVSMLYPVNLFLNILLAGFIYTLGFAFYRALKHPTIIQSFMQRLQGDSSRIMVEILLAALFSGIIYFLGMEGLVYFAAMVSLVFLYRFLKVLENESLSQQIGIDELEEGDVIGLENLDIGAARKKGGLGRALESVRKFVQGLGFSRFSSILKDAEERVGYPEVVGVSEDEIHELRNSGVETVEVREGARFVPVFAIALFVTDVFGGGIFLLVSVF